MRRFDKEGKQMLLTVKSVYDNPVNNFSVIRPGFVVPMNLVSDQILKIIQAETHAATPIKGDTVDKSKKFELLGRSLFHITSAASAYASAPATANPELKAKVNFTLPQIKRIAYVEIEAFANNIIEAVTPIIADLSDYGTVQADLTDAVDKLKDFLEVQTKPQTNIDERKVYNADIHPFVKEGKRLLAEMCDPIANTLFNTHHDLYELWYNARAIIDLPEGTTIVEGYVFKPDGTTPIYNAKVFFPEQDITTYTFIDGSYRVTKFPYGVAQPIASYGTASQQAAPFQVKKGHTVKQNFTLEI